MRSGRRSLDKFWKELETETAPLIEPIEDDANHVWLTVLLAKGYEIVKYDEFNGGHEYLNWRGSLADGLIALIGK